MRSYRVRGYRVTGYGGTELRGTEVQGTELRGVVLSYKPGIMVHHPGIVILRIPGDLIQATSVLLEI